MTATPSAGPSTTSAAPPTAPPTVPPTASAVAPPTASPTDAGSGTNWSGNVTFSARGVVHPRSVEELQEVVVAAEKLRVLGSRHSFNTIADSPDMLVSLTELPQEFSIDRQHNRVTVPAGVRFGDIYRSLDAAGLALHNTGSLPHISVVGATATATHGSGVGNGNLATAVAALELVTADGEVRTVTRERDGDALNGAVVGLGCLGVVTRATLDVQPSYAMRQDIYDNLSFDAFAAHADEVFGAAYSVSLFTLWRDRTFHQVWLKTRLDGDDPGSMPADLFGAVPADRPRHMIPGISPIACTQQLGVPGPWFERLPHFRLDFTPSAGEEIQTEYFVAREHAVEALLALEPLDELLADVLLVSEIRTIAADDLWLSPAYHRASVAFHFTWVRDQAAVEAVLPEIERRLEPFDPRAHWGKVFTTSPDRLASLYDRLPDFRALAADFDPEGKFRNAFVDANVWNGVRG